MFLWDKSVSALGVPAGQVVHLFRSMRPVQLALPGMPVQQASAFLCQYRGAAGIVTTAAFHLEKQSQLAFYFGDPKEVAAAKADGMLDQGLNFVESMGFLLADLDIHLLSGSDRDLLWDSLPLKAGVEPAEDEPKATEVKVVKPPAVAAKAEEAKTVEAKAPVVPPPAPGPVASAPAKRVAAPPVVAEPAAVQTPATPETKTAVPAPPAAAKPAAPKPTTPDATEAVDDLLAAVSALRANRPGLRARKTPPPPEELDRRRKEFRENMGRILASL